MARACANHGREYLQSFLCSAIKLYEDADVSGVRPVVAGRNGDDVEIIGGLGSGTERRSESSPGLRLITGKRTFERFYRTKGDIRNVCNVEY